MGTEKSTTKKTVKTQPPEFFYKKPKGAYFDYVPPAALLEPDLNRPEIGFSVTVADVLHCYCVANQKVVDVIDENVKAWFEKEADTKGWQNIKWWDRECVNAVAIHPKPKKHQPRAKGC